MTSDPCRLSTVDQQPTVTEGAPMSRLVSLALFSALLATPAFAQTPKTKYTRPTPVQVEVKLSDKVKPIASKPAEAAKPVLTSELALSIEGLRGKFQAEQEQILRELIAQTPDREVDEKADLYFRLGEL